MSRPVSAARATSENPKPVETPNAIVNEAEGRRRRTASGPTRRRSGRGREHGGDHDGSQRRARRAASRDRAGRRGGCRRRTRARARSRRRTARPRGRARSRRAGRARRRISRTPPNASRIEAGARCRSMWARPSSGESPRMSAAASRQPTPHPMSVPGSRIAARVLTPPARSRLPDCQVTALIAITRGSNSSSTAAASNG